MTPLDVALHDEAARFGAREELVCTCRTCGVTAILLRAKLVAAGVRTEDTRRVAVRPFDCRSASYPFVASVTVDGMEIYRIMNRPDEVFEPDVMADIIKALRRPM